MNAIFRAGSDLSGWRHPALPSDSAPCSSLLSSHLMGAHLVDFTPCEMRRGLSNSGSVLYRFVEGQQGEAELVLEQKNKIKNAAVMVHSTKRSL